MDSASIPRPIRFGVFEVDLRTGELRKQGLKLKLQIQPFRILAMLLERPGELVTREEIREKLWPGDTFIDFEHSVNSSIKKLREALGDDAETPRYIETLPRRGYRFIAPLTTPESPPQLRRGLRGGAAAPVETVAPVASPATSAAGTPPLQPVGAVREPPLRKHWRLAATGGSAAILVLLALALNVAGLRDRLLTSVGARHGVPLPKIESIAVLPLENLSGNPEQEYFADGMTDELIATLAKIGSLRVISRTSAMQYKRTKKPLPQIGRELNVDAVVEGTVLRSGERVRITAQLVHAPTDRHLWAETYESDLGDVLVMQSEVARAIATEIQIKLSTQEEARLTVARPVNPEAYEAYLKGNYARTRGFVGAASAIQYFHRAIATDPGYAQPYVGLCLTYANMTGGLGLLPPRESFAQMNQAALKALELDAKLGEAHTCLAWGNAFGEWDWAGGERDFKQAIELSPSSPEAHAWYSLFLSAMGRHEEAIAESKRALELDPVSPGASDGVAGAYWWARQYERAADQSEKVIQMDPTRPGAQHTRGLVDLQTGSYYEAIRRYQRAIALSGKDAPAWFVGLLGVAYGRAGKRTEALEILHELESRSKHQYVSPYLVADLLANMNYKDRAFQWLEKAYAERNPMLAFLRVEPVIDPLRSDPRFQDLLRRMNFPP